MKRDFRQSSKLILAATVAATALFALCHVYLASAHSLLSSRPLPKQESEFARLGGRPAIAQQNIDLALEAFGIEIPPGVNPPVLDVDCPDRGAYLIKTKTVSIGPAAFESWAILGSTLSHELEIHARQSIPMVWVMPFFGVNGLVRAEREAYLHEIASAKRFGLTDREVSKIRAAAVTTGVLEK